MVDFDKFEKLVKQKYGEQEFPFDEANWEKASKMIDASRQGKNRGGIWLLSSVAVLVTTGIVYYFVFANGSNELKKDLATNEPAQNKELVVNSNSQNGTVTEENSNTVSNEGTRSDETTGASAPSTETKNNSSSGVNSSTSKSSVEVNNSATKNSGKAQSDINESKAPANNTNAEGKSNSNSESKANNVKGSESSSNPNTTKKPEQTRAKGKVSISPVGTSGNAANQNSQNPKNSSSSPNNGETGSTTRLGEGENTGTTDPTLNNSTLTDSSNAVVMVDIKPVESVVIDSSSNIAQLPADSFKLPPPATNIKGDGISYATNVSMEHNYKNFLFMEAGTTYLLGWGSGTQNDATGFNLVAGLNFQHYFTNNFSAQLGVQYNNINNLTHTSHTISTINYDFGIEQDVTAIRYQKLHYVVAPVKVSYTLKKNNIISLGCNVAYLLNSESKKEKYKTYSTDPNATKNNLKTSKESGYVQGFNPIDVQVSVAYRRKIFKGFSANAEFIYGLTDVKNNNFFKSDNFDRNMGFKVTLCYDLFKK